MLMQLPLPKKVMAPLVGTDVLAQLKTDQMIRNLFGNPMS
jgi:hypothetical protein